MTRATNRILKTTFCVLLAIIAIVTVIFSIWHREVFAADDAPPTASSPTFSVIDGQKDSKGNKIYTNVFDNDTSTKYCIDITLNPYITFRANDVSTTVTGYKLYTGDDTAKQTGRNPKDWLLYGSIDGTNWTTINEVTGDTTMGTENKTGYSFTIEGNTTPYLFYKLAITARQGESGDDFDLMQISEIEFEATVSAPTDVNTETALGAVFETGGKAKLVGDIALTSDLSVDKKAVELDLNGYVLRGQKLNVLGAAAESGSVLVLKDSRPDATHTDATLPVGGVVTSELHLTRNPDSESWGNNAFLYANGGTVTQTLYVDTGSAQVDYFGNYMTTFMSGVYAAKGIKLNGGLYYGSITNTKVDNPYTTSNKKVEFKIGDSVYATQYLRSGDKAMIPTAPTLAGYTFIKWYNASTNDYYDYTNTITSDLTIKAMWMKEVGTFDELVAEISSGNSVKLTADITLTNNLNVSSGKNVMIDLNGHVIGGSKQINGKGCGGTQTPGPATKLTIIDSNPTATHTDASLPIGGYINTTISVTASSITSATGYFNLHANGGTIRSVHCPSFACFIIWSDNTPSVIKNVTGSTGGANPTSKGGLYYYDRQLDSKSKKVTYKDGDKVYAVLGISDETASKKAVIPKEPDQKSGYAFDGWYYGDDKYDFSTLVEKNITLTAKWVEDTTAPVISGVDADGKYCGQELTVTDAYLDNVTVDGIKVELTNGKFTFDISAGTDRVIVATDKAFNSTTLTVTFGHNWSTTEIIAKVDADCENDGTKAHWHCNACGKNYDDDKTTELTDTDLAISAAHTYGEWIDEVSATIESEGTKAHKDCSVCGKHFDENGVEIIDLTISKISNDNEGLSAGAIVGITIGSVAVAGVGGFAVFWFVIKKNSFAELIGVIKKVFKK